MFTNSFNHIKNTFRSSFFTRTHLSEEPFSVRVADLRTGKLALVDGPGTSAQSSLQSLQPPGKLATEFDASSASSFDHSEQASPRLGVSSSTESIYTTLLSPNTRLFRGSQDEFGFDVYITHGGYRRDPAYLFECPSVLPWDELAIALAAETGLQSKNIVLSSQFYPGVVKDKASYQAWLAWSKETDGPCSTDLWLP